jgi:hypothetical protein
MKSLIKALMALTPWRIVRDTGVNPFQRIYTSLTLLKTFGYEPRTIIDGDAHLGQFALQAKALFPEAIIHMVEPQPACRQELKALADTHKFPFSPVCPWH